MNLFPSASKVILPCLPALLLLAGCAGPRMVPPEDVSKGSAVLDVPKRSSASGALVNESFDLGSYHVTKVDRKSVKQNNSNVFGYAKSKTSTGYSYQVDGGKGTWTGTCGYGKSEKGFSMGGTSIGGQNTSLTCECSDGKGQSRLELKSVKDEFSGTLAVAGQSYTVSPVKTMDKKYFGAGPAGYRLDAADGPRGAVEVLHPGRVWLGDKLPEEAREPTACIFTGLMLFVEPREE